MCSRARFRGVAVRRGHPRPARDARSVAPAQTRRIGVVAVNTWFRILGLVVLLVGSIVGAYLVIRIFVGPMQIS